MHSFFFTASISDFPSPHKMRISKQKITSNGQKIRKDSKSTDEIVFRSLVLSSSSPSRKYKTKKIRGVSKKQQRLDEALVRYPSHCKNMATQSLRNNSYEKKNKHSTSMIKKSTQTEVECFLNAVGNCFTDKQVRDALLFPHITSFLKSFQDFVEKTHGKSDEIMSFKSLSEWGRCDNDDSEEFSPRGVFWSSKKKRIPPTYRPAKQSRKVYYHRYESLFDVLDTMIKDTKHRRAVLKYLRKDIRDTTNEKNTHTPPSHIDDDDSENCFEDLGLYESHISMSPHLSDIPHWLRAERVFIFCQSNVINALGDKKLRYGDDDDDKIGYLSDIIEEYRIRHHPQMPNSRLHLVTDMTNEVLNDLPLYMGGIETILDFGTNLVTPRNNIVYVDKRKAFGVSGCMVSGPEEFMKDMKLTAHHESIRDDVMVFPYFSSVRAGETTWYEYFSG